MLSEYSKFEKDLDALTVNNLDVITAIAGTLSLSECYDYLAIFESDLSSTDKKLAELAHRRGLAMSIQEAGSHLFRQMQTKGGGQVAMDYLRRISANFADESTPLNANGFSLTINS